MPASKYKISVEQGATYTREITWKAGSPSVPVDLTGCTARLQMRAEVEAADVLYEMTTGNGRIVLGGTAGTVTLTIPAADSSAFGWTGAVYDLEIVFPNGTVKRLLQGSVVVSPEVTR